MKNKREWYWSADQTMAWLTTDSAIAAKIPANAPAVHKLSMGWYAGTSSSPTSVDIGPFTTSKEAQAIAAAPEFLTIMGIRYQQWKESRDDEAENYN